MDGTDFSLISLNLLLKAPEKALVQKCINLTFASRGDVPQPTVDTLQALLDITCVEALQLYRAIYACIDVSLVNGSIEALGELFETHPTAGEIDARLKNLIGQIIRSKLDLWKESSFLNRVSLPKYIDVDWAVHIEKSSSQVAQMQVPIALIEVEIETERTHVSDPIGITRKLNFEVNKESLETMLEGLGKIRDQLSTMS